MKNRLIKSYLWDRKKITRLVFNKSIKLLIVNVILPRLLAVTIHSMFPISGVFMLVKQDKLRVSPTSMSSRDSLIRTIADLVISSEF